MRILLAALLTALAAPAVAELAVEDAYVRGLPPGVANTAVYMTLVNRGTAALELVGVSTAVAGAALLHDTTEHGGMLHMMPAPGMLVPAGGELKLESGGAHIMLMDLAGDLVVGGMVELVLVFADGQRSTVLAPVRSVLDE